MKIKYRIKWFHVDTKKRLHHGEPCLTQKDAVYACAIMNLKYPELKHIPEKCVFGDFRDRFVVAES